MGRVITAPRCIRCDRVIKIDTDNDLCILCMTADEQSKNPRGTVVKNWNGKRYPVY